MTKKWSSISRRMDGFGACLSSACVIHCVIMPLVVGGLSVSGLGFLADERIESALFTLAIALALASTALGWRTHRRVPVVLGFAAALVVTVVGRVLGEDELIGRTFMIAGALAIATCHLVSRHGMRKTRACAQ